MSTVLVSQSVGRPQNHLYSVPAMSPSRFSSSFLPSSQLTPSPLRSHFLIQGSECNQIQRLATWAMFLGRLSSRRNPHFSARVQNWGRIPCMRNESERRSPPLPRPPPIRDHPLMTSAIMGGTTKEVEVRRLRELYCVDQYQMWTWGRGLIIQKNCRRHI